VSGGGEKCTMSGFMVCTLNVGVQVSIESRIFSSLHRPDWLWGPSSLVYNGHRGGFSPEVKRLGRKADLSSPTSAEVK
jgi:hypothetical protein